MKHMYDTPPEPVDLSKVPRLSNLFAADQPIVPLKRELSYVQSKDAFDYVPTPRSLPRKDISQIVFRPASKKACVSKRYFHREHMPKDTDFFCFEALPVKPRNIEQKSSYEVFSLLGREDVVRI